MTKTTKAYPVIQSKFWDMEKMPFDQKEALHAAMVADSKHTTMHVTISLPAPLWFTMPMGGGTVRVHTLLFGFGRGLVHVVGQVQTKDGEDGKRKRGASIHVDRLPAPVLAYVVIRALS